MQKSQRVQCTGFRVQFTGFRVQCTGFAELHPTPDEHERAENRPVQLAGARHTPRTAAPPGPNYTRLFRAPWAPHSFRVGRGPGRSAERFRSIPSPGPGCQTPFFHVGDSPNGWARPSLTQAPFLGCAGCRGMGARYCPLSGGRYRPLSGPGRRRLWRSRPGRGAPLSAAIPDETRPESLETVLKRASSGPLHPLLFRALNEREDFVSDLFRRLSAGDPLHRKGSDFNRTTAD